MVQSYLLENADIKMEVLNIGCVIRTLATKNKDGVFENIVLGFADVEEYCMPGGPNFGSVVGQVAGRIKDGKFSLEGKDYHMEQNNNGHFLHGGSYNYGTRIWEVVAHTPTKIKYRLEQLAVHTKMPADVVATVTYELVGNELLVTYTGESTADTIWDPTQHTYWNLSGNMQSPTVAEHRLMIAAADYGELDTVGMVTNEIFPVDGTVFDVRKDEKLVDILASTDEQLLRGGGGIDHPFVLEKQDGTVARLFDVYSRRMLEVATDKPIIVCYTGNQLTKDILLFEGVAAEKYGGICLETQFFPNAVNIQNGMDIPLLSKGTTHTSTTQFTFSVVE